LGLSHHKSSTKTKSRNQAGDRINNEKGILPVVVVVVDSFDIIIVIVIVSVRFYMIGRSPFLFYDSRRIGIC
jgi:hypothetical protein